MSAESQASDRQHIWLGNVPVYWDVKALKFCADLVTERVDGLSAGGATYVGLEHIESKTGRLIRTEGSQDSAESTVNRFRTGDVLFGKLRPYLGKAAVAETEGVCSSEILVYRPHGLTPQYLKHVMLLESFIEEVNSSTYGSKMPRADASFISRLAVPQPPIEEQVAIAFYLDAETARIDGLIEEKTKLLKCLQGMRSAIIVAAMLHGGTDDNLTGYRDAPWMGRIPSHWKRMTLTRVVESACDGPFGSSLKSEHYTDDGIPVIRLQNIGNGEFLTGDPAFISEEYFRDLGGHDAVPGDMVVASLGDERRSPGRACVVPTSIEQALVKADCFRFRLDPTTANSDFVALQLNSLCRPFFQFTAKGTTRQRVTISDVRRCPIALPSLDEQQRVVATVRREQEEVASLIAHVQGELIVLSELRAATITDAVLGRIDLREHMKI